MLSVINFARKWKDGYGGWQSARLRNRLASHFGNAVMECHPAWYLVGGTFSGTKRSRISTLVFLHTTGMLDRQPKS